MRRGRSAEFRIAILLILLALLASGQTPPQASDAKFKADCAEIEEFAARFASGPVEEGLELDRLLAHAQRDDISEFARRCLVRAIIGSSPRSIPAVVAYAVDPDRKTWSKSDAALKEIFRQGSWKFVMEVVRNILRPEMGDDSILLGLCLERLEEHRGLPGDLMSRLLGLARYSPDCQKQHLARLVARSPEADAESRAEAQDILDADVKLGKLVQAIFEGDTDLQKSLIEDPAVNVSAVWRPGGRCGEYVDHSPLMAAVKSDNPEAVYLLCKRGADPNVKCWETRPVFVAVRKGFDSIGRLLRLFGASDDPDLIIKTEEVIAAARVGGPVQGPGIPYPPYVGPAGGMKVKAHLRDLLEQGSDPDGRDEVGNTPLMYAAGYGCQDHVYTLISFGADPARRNDSGRTAADFASRGGHPSVAKYLSEVKQLVRPPAERR